MENHDKTQSDILTRSVANVLPSREALQAALSSEKKLRIYIGADATGPQLHLGHATNFMLLEKFRRMGHEAIVLFGDFTAMLGDPTDKTAARVQLSKEQVKEHIKTWKSQVEKILNFTDPENPARIVYNSDWLASMNLSDMIGLASNFTVQHMLERDMFEKRMDEGKPIFLHEFLYPLLQGYDSVALDADVEIGGTDQTFNMLAGRTLQKRFHNKEKFVIATTLLEDPETKKKLMSKSEGGFVALNDPPKEMFAKIMALSDGVIIQLFTDCTYVPLKDIAEIAEKIVLNELNPRDAKLQLAKEIVRMYHGEAAADTAQQEWISTVSQRQLPADILEIEVQYEPATHSLENLGTFIARVGFAESKTDARRKIEQGGVTLGEEKMAEGMESRIFTPVDHEKVLRVGKKHFAKVMVLI